MLLFFAITLFSSALLLFLVQPMFAKMVLPLLGGTPAVWNTCMVFFQAALLAGYAYAHATTDRLGVRRQAALHLALLGLAVAVLPIRLPTGWVPPAERNPIPWLFAVSLVAVGLPFFMLATTTPTLQKWFAQTGHVSARDPYFLYAASNLGSMLALVSYPLLLEPNLRLAEQSWLWAGGYGLLLVLTLGCAVVAWRAPAQASHNPGPAPAVSAPDSAAGVTRALRLRWVALAFAPSSLMLGVTTYLTTDIPPIPLFWVVPLAIYLLTFILVFARKPPVSHALMVERLPFLVLAAAITIFAEATEPVWLLMPLHLLTFFVAAMVCHGELARGRPQARHLTEFYLWLAVGGVLGGLFNALVAPVVFDAVIEYPLVLGLASMLRPASRAEQQKPRATWVDFALPGALGAGVVALIVGLRAAGFKPGQLLQFLIFAPAAMLCLSFAKRRLRFGLGVVAMLLASLLYTGPHGRVLHTVRSFFGVNRVYDAEGKYRLLVHGSTVHGMQSLDPARAREPLAYYARTGPIGQVFAAFDETLRARPIGVIGLGAGSLACYGAPGQEFTFYEIDPTVEQIARDPRYFTYLRDCPPEVRVVLGDARLTLAHAPERRYGLLVLDAFSSDTVPLHLLTREALRLYLGKVAEGGVLAFHVSNRHFNLAPVLGALADDAGLVCLGQDDLSVSAAETQQGKLPSRWVVMAQRAEDLAPLAHDARWRPLGAQAGSRVWTDDFSNTLRLINWD